MHQIINQLTSYLIELSKAVPLPFYAFFGSIVDEVIAFLPSPFIPLTAGSMAYEQGSSYAWLLVLALCGTIGKTMATCLTYWIADKLEDFLTGSKIGKLLGVEKDEIEKYGRYFDGSKKDEIIMVILRALPFVPTLPVSVVAGVLKIRFSSFIITTFIGTYIRFMFYMIVAYEGVKKYQNLLDQMDTLNTILEVGIVLCFLGVAFLFMRKHWDKLFSLLLNKSKKIEK